MKQKFLQQIAFIFFAFYIASPIFMCVSCAYKKESAIPFYAKNDAAVPLYGLSQSAINGIFYFGNQKQYEYELEYEIAIAKNYALQVDYVLTQETPQNAASDYSVVLRIDNEAAWQLPLDGAFAGIETIKHDKRRFRYIVPISAERIKKIHFSTNAKTAKQNENRVAINSLSIVPKIFGLIKKSDCYAASPSRAEKRSSDPLIMIASPFFVKEKSANSDVSSIDPDDKYRIEGKTALFLNGIESNTKIYFAETGFLYQSGSAERQNLVVPFEMLPQDPYPVLVSGDADCIVLAAAGETAPEFISADPGFILSYPYEKWRSKQYEYFSWDIFPSIIIFDTENYAVQDKLFKRLAFFAEKKGFRGRLAADAEIDGLHGWNAHDYNAATLARFFDMVKKTNFPIIAQEKELCRILLKAGIIKDNADGSGYDPGEGAVLSISRESPLYLRRMFMAHEGFHGIFFIDEKFRDFTKQRWDNFKAVPKRFLLSYFDYQQYDLQDQYLILNEFMAHCLQQPVASASEYFGKTIAKRIEESSWRKNVLPQKDEETESWPELAEAFSAEAAAFSNYVNSRWGLRAGRVWRVSPVQ